MSDNTRSKKGGRPEPLQLHNEPDDVGEHDVEMDQAERDDGAKATIDPKKVATPAVVRTRQLRALIGTESPSDGTSCMSPCSSKLLKQLGARQNDEHVHHPAMLKPKRLQNLASEK